MIHSIKKNPSPLAIDAMTLMVSRGLTTQNIKKNVFGVTAYNQPYNSPLQICITGRMHFSKKKNSATCSFQIGTKNPTKFITITGEKCTRAHVQENKSIYVSIYLSI